MLLIHPPQARNCEPPVAPAHLAGALREAGEEVLILDGSLESYHWLSEQDRGDDKDLQAQRVYRNRNNLLDQSQWHGSLEDWKRRIADLRQLGASSFAMWEKQIRFTPADYDDPNLTPLRSEDLFHSWNHPEENPYYPWFTKRLKELMEKRESSTIAFSITYLSQALTGMAMAGWINTEYPYIPFIIGGGLINSWLKGPAGEKISPRIRKYMVAGSGEENVVKFTGRQYRGPGLPYYPSLEKYIAPGKILPYSASRGCSWKRCTFCSELWEDNPYCETPAEIAVNQLKMLSEKYDPQLIHLCDSEVSPLVLRELIKHPPGPNWYSFSRFLSDMTDISYCRSLADSGCAMLCLGLESGDEAVLKSLKKGIRLDYVSKILGNLKIVGILTYVYIMFGTPAENRQAAENTRDFIMRHSAHIDFLNVSIFNMPVNSAEARDLESGDFYDGDLSLYKEFNHPGQWNRGEIRNFLSRDFRKQPEIREILKRTPPVFTSNLAPFLNMTKKV